MPSSQLNAGPSPPSYGAFRPTNSSTPSQGPSHSPTPHVPRFAAPGPTSSQSPAPQPAGASPHKKRTSLVTSLIIVLFQVICILVVYRSDTLASFIDLESKAYRASMEVSALVAEREKWEQEKENMRHDRELWEQVPEDRVPWRAHWDHVWSHYECRAYGKREYQGVLRGIPAGWPWSAIDVCMNTPVSIDLDWDRPPVKIQRPYRCVFDGSLNGYWIVDRGQDDCEPELRAVHDTVCQGFPSVQTAWISLTF